MRKNGFSLGVLVAPWWLFKVLLFGELQPGYRMNIRKKNIILYYRSYLLTLGIFFSAFSLWFAFANYQRHEFFEVFTLILFVVFLCVGGVLAWFGVYGPAKRIEVWANSTSKHWASIFVFILAYPIYVIWKSSQNKQKA